jgi:hypothetical protein
MDFLPNEIITLILICLKNPKEVYAKRKVCRKWKILIDELEKFSNFRLLFNESWYVKNWNCIKENELHLNSLYQNGIHYILETPKTKT